MKRGILLGVLLAMLISMPVKAETTTAWATAYCLNGTTATGTKTTEGRTIAGKREWFGKTLVLWEDKGNGIEPNNYIGTYVCEDIGGSNIQKGYVVDVYISSLERAKQFGSKRVIIQIIESEG